MIRKTKLDQIVNRNRESLKAKKRFQHQSRINKFKKSPKIDKEENVLL